MRIGRRASSTARVVLATVVIGISIASPLTAQGGMGGGGMGGGMGGGRGRGGMGGRGMGGERMKSPVDMVKERLEQNDPLKFLLDRKKPLSLSDTQRDTLKRFQKEMEDAQRPTFKELETLSSSMPGRGGMGGGMSGGGGGRRGGSGDTVRVLADKLTDIQDSFRDRARGQLNPEQRLKADSLEQIWLAELRKKDEEQREKRRSNGRGEPIR